MKTLLKSILALAVVLGASIAASALPKALYVKKGDTYLKYNFGVAGDLKFSNGGNTLTITGYAEAIDLTAIDYITFSAPVDNNALTPSAQKNKLIQIGQDVYSKAKCSDHPGVIRMVDRFCTEYSNYFIPEEYYNVHSDDDTIATAPSATRLMSRMLTALKQCVNGDASAVRAIKRNGVELYRLNDYYGIYQANTSTEQWDKIANADYFEMRYPAADTDFYKIKVQASGNVMHWDESDFASDIPERLDLTFIKGDTLLCTGSITFDVARGTKLNSTINLVSNNLVVNNDIRTDSAAITDHLLLTIDNTAIVNTQNVLHGRHLLDYDDWKADMDQGHGYSDGYDDNGHWFEVDGNYDNIAAHRFTYGTSETDILNGRLQVSGKVSQLGKLWDKMQEDAYMDTYTYIETNGGANRTYYDDNKDVVQTKVDHLNNYSDISFYYDGTSQMQGFIAWDIDEDYDDWYQSSDGYYDDASQDWVTTWEGLKRYAYIEIMPMLVFPDLTSYAITDYFNKTNFGSLVDDYNAIIDDYYNIVGRDRNSTDNPSDY